MATWKDQYHRRVSLVQLLVALCWRYSIVCFENGLRPSPGGLCSVHLCCTERSEVKPWDRMTHVAAHARGQRSKVGDQSATLTKDGVLGRFHSHQHFPGDPQKELLRLFTNMRFRSSLYSQTLYTTAVYRQSSLMSDFHLLPGWNLEAICLHTNQNCCSHFFLFKNDNWKKKSLTINHGLYIDFVNVL